MIDAWTYVFNYIAPALRLAYPDIYVTGEYTPTPAHFPAVFIYEMDNYAYRQTQDSGSLENHAVIPFQIDVYSNLSSGKKTQCDSIMTTIDELMQVIGYTRTMCQPVPNEAEASIYRKTARYSAVVGKDGTVYRP